MDDSNKELIDLARRMRQAQRDYFAHRQPESLDLARDLEKRFDRLLDRLTMPDLFREDEQQ